MQEILGIFGIDMRLLLVQAFNFGVLLLALWYFLYTPVTTMLEKRKRVIEEGVRDAEKVAEERENILAEKEAILADSTHEAGIMMDRAKERAEEKEASLLKASQERSDRMLEDARLKSEEEKRRILESSKDEMARMIVLGAEKVLKESK